MEQVYMHKKTGELFIRRTYSLFSDVQFETVSCGSSTTLHRVHKYLWTDFPYRDEVELLGEL